MKLGLLAIGLSVFVVGSTAAHHNWAAIYDVDGDIEFEGVISSIEFRNPHVRMSFTVDQGTPNEMVYTTESNSVASLTRMGVTEELVSVGTRVRVAGYPSRTRDDDMFMNHLLLLDEGREIVFLRTAEARWPEESQRVGNTDVAHGRVVEDDISKRPTSIFGVWSTIYGTQGSHAGLRGIDVEWTEYGEQNRSDAPVDPKSCAPRDILGVLAAPYPIEIIDNGDGTITIHAEHFDTIRTVHMGDMPENPDIPRESNGYYSAGRFVGDTLVIDTLKYREGGRDGDDYMQISETFALSEDRNRLLYSQVVVDPLFRASPTLAKKWWQYVPGSFVQPYDCSY